MRRLASLVAGGLGAVLLLAGGGHGEPRHDSSRGGAPTGRKYGGERSLGPGYGYGGGAFPRGYEGAVPRGNGGGVPRGYGYERPAPAYGARPGYRPAPSPYRSGYPGAYRPSYSGYPPPSYRQNSLGADWREQQEEARAGVRHGRMAPLGRVIEGIGRRSAGRPLDAGIEYDGARAVYRVRWMTAHGRRVDYIVDAATGAILSEH